MRRSGDVGTRAYPQASGGRKRALHATQTCEHGSRVAAPHLLPRLRCKRVALGERKARFRLISVGRVWHRERPLHHTPVADMLAGEIDPCSNEHTNNLRGMPMLRRILHTIAGWFRFEGATGANSDRPAQRFALQAFEDRSTAAAAAERTGVAALVCKGGSEKWLLMRCPCGCGQQIALNLMQSHSPRWSISVQSANRFSVHPSIDATSCGAHFWIRDGLVIWSQ